MSVCPYCHTEGAVVLGRNSHGWILACEVCDRQWVVAS